MQNQTLDTIRDLIGEAKHIAVVLNGESSLDATAAALSLYLALIGTGKKADIVSPEPPTVALGNLVGVNKIRQYHGANSAGLVISLPYQQGAIEKISYDIVGDRINLTVVSGPAGLTFSTDDIVYLAPTQKADLIVSVGVPQEAQVSTIVNDTQSHLINIDNSFENPGFGTVALLDTLASSRSELVAKLLSALNMPIDRDIAQNLLSGIVDATDNFQREDTSPSAFEVAAMLIAKGASRTMGAPSPRDATGVRASRAWQKQPQEKPASTKSVYGANRLTTRFNAIGQPDDLTQQTGTAAPAGGGAGKSTATQAPKDWFEPKIYSGKTPIS